MKKFLGLVAVLSIILFGFGTSHAVVGVADDVPGTDVVIPFICDVAPGTQNTLWAIAETSNLSGAADVYLFNVRSEFVLDYEAEWTPRDVVVDDCQSLIASLGDVQRAALRTTITKNGVSVPVYAGYVVYFNLVIEDQFIPWVYLVDMPSGFATGFNGFAAEGGIDASVTFPNVPSNLTEAGTAVSTSFLYPRFFFLNNNAGSYNHWIILKGGAPLAAHVLSGFICDEEEVCRSLNIPIPNNLNIIDVRPHIPAILLTAGAGGGFGIFYPTPAAIQRDRTILGWAYQRAATAGVITNWDVTHPMHRQYPPPLPQ